MKKILEIQIKGALPLEQLKENIKKIVLGLK